MSLVGLWLRKRGARSGDRIDYRERPCAWRELRLTGGAATLFSLCRLPAGGERVVGHLGVGHEKKKKKDPTTWTVSPGCQQPLWLPSVAHPLWLTLSLVLTGIDL